MIDIGVAIDLIEAGMAGMDSGIMANGIESWPMES